MTRHQHRIEPRLIAILDWYFDETADPSMATSAARFQGGVCELCGASVGELHKLGCRRYGELNLGGVRGRGSSQTGEPANLRRLAAIGLALHKLEPAQRDAIEVAWTFRRLWKWWSKQPGNLGKWCSKALPEYAAVSASKKEIRALANFYKREWERVKRKPACRLGLNAMSRTANCGAIW